MIEVEYIQDEIYYWLVFTVFFSILSVIGAALFVASYKLMVYLREKKLKKKAWNEFGLVPNFDNTRHNLTNRTLNSMHSAS
jgi:hypothetical protein